MNVKMFTYNVRTYICVWKSGLCLLKCVSIARNFINPCLWVVLFILCIRRIKKINHRNFLCFLILIRTTDGEWWNVVFLLWLAAVILFHLLTTAATAFFVFSLYSLLTYNLYLRVSLALYVCLIWLFVLLV